jgi:uncharacterized membrane protein
MNKQSRPVISLPCTPLEVLLEAFAALGIITVITVTAWGWLILPATIPTHYGLSGEPNAYGGKESLLILPIISICSAVLLAVVSRFPHRCNYPWPITPENAPRQYALARQLLHWIMLEIAWMLCALQWAIIQAAQSQVGGDAILLVSLAMVVTLIVTIILYFCFAARAR